MEDNLKIKCSRLFGTIQAPPSKSHLHRVTIASALAGEISKELEEFAKTACDDTAATYDCVTKLKCNTGANFPVTLNAKESGSTLRFLLPLSCALGREVKWTGEGRLLLRPIDSLISALTKCGADISRENGAIVTHGGLKAGVFELDAKVSSQYVSGLMFCLPLLDGDSEIVVREAASKPYIDLTIDVLKAFNIGVQPTADGYFVRGGQKYLPTSVKVEGDFSGASFFMVAGALAGDVKIEGLSPRSLQADRGVFELLKRAGANICFEGDAVHIKESKLRPISYDANDMIDSVPIMATALAFAKGKSQIFGVNRLKDKESDRIESTMHLLSCMGVKSEYDGDALTIFGGEPREGKFESFCDHRIAMSATVAGLKLGGELSGATCVKKSYARFFEDVKTLGGKVEFE